MLRWFVDHHGVSFVIIGGLIIMLIRSLIRALQRWELIPDPLLPERWRRVINRVEAKALEASADSRTYGAVAGSLNAGKGSQRGKQVFEGGGGRMGGGGASGSFALIAVFLLACGSNAIAAGNPLFGTWRGKSLCTPVRPACHDEIAVYHIAPSRKTGKVAMTMNKVVDGQEVEMGGTLDYDVDYETRTLTCPMGPARDGTRGEWRFTWSGKKMTGTLIQLPGREVIRNIALDKQ